MPDEILLPPTIPGFSIERLLGHGGMGSVYLAKDEKLQRNVAVKVLHKLTPNHFKILNEARANAQITHNHVVQVFDVVEFDSQYALIMEYIEGKSLFRYIKEQQVSFAQRVNLLEQISKGLQAIHNKQIIHCDLKPDNILITPDGQVKISDFGIAKHTENKNDGSTYAQSVWTSPEIIEGKPPSHASDLYNLGLIATWLLIENPSHPSEPNLQVLQNVNSSMSLLPEGLLNLLKSLTQKKAKYRPSTIVQVIQTIEYWHIAIAQEESGQLATQPIETKPSIKHMLREWGVTPLKVVSLVLIGLVMTFSGNYFYQQHKINQIKYVAFLPPKFHYPKLNEQQQISVRSILQDTLHNAVLDTESLYLIPQEEIYSALEAAKVNSELNNIQLTNQLKLDKVAGNTGASILLGSELDCDVDSCQIQLFHYTKDPNSDKWLITGKRSFPTQQSYSYNMSVDIEQELYRLLDVLPHDTFKHKKIPDDLYKEYIEIFSDIAIRKISNDEIFEQLQNLIKQNPRFTPSYSLLSGLTYSLYNQTNKAKYVDGLESVLSIIDEEKFPEIALIIRYDVNALRKDKEKAEQALEELSSISIDRIKLLRLRANFSLTFNDYKSAINYYNQLISFRYSREDLYNIGTSYWSLRDFENSKKYLNLALEIDKNDQLTLNALATIYLLEGNFLKAEEIYSQLLLLSNDRYSLSNLSLVYLLQGQYKKAEEFAKKAVDLNSISTFSLINYADALTLSGKTEAAQAIYFEVIKNANFNDPYSYLDIALAYANLNQPHDAIVHLNKARELIENDLSTITYIAALIYTIIEENHSAIVESENALQYEYNRIWYNLPWFKRLCKHQKFKHLMTLHNLSTCTSTN